MNLTIDHLIVCVGNLDEAANNFKERLGLSSVEGGRHPGHGTANRIIPLGGCYIELLAVVDPSEAKNSTAGVDLAIAESLPLFIEWHVPEDQMPGRTHVIHDHEVYGIEEIVLSGDTTRLMKWTDEVPIIRIVEGPSSIVSVSLATPEGRFAL